MTLSIISMIVMAVMAVVMLVKGQFASTRQMAMVPFMALVMEALACGMLSTSFVVTTILLTVLRVGIVLCCVGELHRDRVRARRRRARRDSFVRQMAHAQPVRRVPAVKQVQVECA